MEDNDAKTVSSIDHENDDTQDSFQPTELSNSYKSPNTRTAALFPHYPGFQ